MTMADNTKIEWTDATWNPVTGCSVVSPGCSNCYAMRLAGTRMKHHPSRAGLTEPSKAGPVWNGQVRFNEEWLDQPLLWRKPRRIFVCAHGDLFHENVPNEWIYAVLAVMAATYDVAGTDDHNVINAYRQRHVYQVLTKRQARMRALMSDLHAVPKKPGLDALLDHPLSRSAQTISRAQGHPFWMNAPLSSWQWVIDGCPGLWLGVSVEDQARADERIPHLLATPAAVRFLSCEPLLGPIDFLTTLAMCQDAPGKRIAVPLGRQLIDWVIAGGESGPGTRPMDIAWVGSLVEQCRAAGIACFVKQLGAKPYWQEDATAPLPLNKKGGDWSEWPAELQVREFPA